MLLTSKDRWLLSGYTLISSIIFLFIVFGNITIAQENDRTSLLEAEKYYKDALFDKVIEILSELQTDESIEKDVRSEALKFLARSYIAKGQYNEAKESLQKLLELEPPIIELNPDYEPPALMKAYYDVRKLLSGGSLVVERPDPGLKTMAIIDFKNSSIDQKAKFDPMEQGFADLMIHRLNNSTGLKVIERERIQWILNEINIQDKYNMEEAVRIGKQLGVHAVLLGSFIIFNDEIWLGARLVKVETSEILLADEIKGDVDDFFDLTEKLSEKIADKIDVKLKQEEAGISTETRSLEAMLSYSEGLQMLEEGKYKDAYNKFLKALEFDPDYELAKAKAESIKPFIG